MKLFNKKIFNSRIFNVGVEESFGISGGGIFIPVTPLLQKKQIVKGALKIKEEQDTAEFYMEVLPVIDLSSNVLIGEMQAVISEPHDKAAINISFGYEEDEEIMMFLMAA